MHIEKPRGPIGALEVATNPKQAFGNAAQHLALTAQTGLLLLLLLLLPLRFRGRTKLLQSTFSVLFFFVLGGLFVGYHRDRTCHGRLFHDDSLDIVARANRSGCSENPGVF